MKCKATKESLIDCRLMVRRHDRDARERFDTLQQVVRLREPAAVWEASDDETTRPPRRTTAISACGTVSDVRCLLAVMLVAGCRIGFDPLATTDGSSDTGPVTYREAVLADHPISYWRLDGTSTSIVDVQQNIDGVFTGTCTYGVAGALAQDSNTAVHFDGQTCEGSFGDNFRFPGTAPMTIELWVRPANPSVSAYEHYFTVETRNPGAVDGYAIFRESGAKVERVVAVATVKTAPFDLLADVWYHMAMVYDGTVTQLYVDGALAQEQADARAINVTGAPALIGAQSAGGWFAGDMDEIAVYDVALPPSRLALHHQIGVSGPQ